MLSAGIAPWLDTAEEGAGRLRGGYTHPLTSTTPTFGSRVAVAVDDTIASVSHVG